MSVRLYEKDKACACVMSVLGDWQYESRILYIGDLAVVGGEEHPDPFLKALLGTPLALQEYLNKLTNYRERERERERESCCVIFLGRMNRRAQTARKSNILWHACMV